MGESIGALTGMDSGGSDLFARVFSPSGQVLSTSQVGSDAADYASAAVLGSDGEIYLAGYTYGVIGPTSVMNAGQGDGFVLILP